MKSHTQTGWTDGALKLKLAGQKDVYGTRRRKTISRGASIRHLLRGKLHWQGAAASFLRKKTRCSNGAFRGHFYNNSRNTHPFVLQYELYVSLLIFRFNNKYFNLNCTTPIHTPTHTYTYTSTP